MTENEVATRYFGLVQGMARARTAGSLAYLRDEVESAAMQGLMEAAKCAARDNPEDPERYVRRTVKLRITDALRRHGPKTRRGHHRMRFQGDSDSQHTNAGFPAPANFTNEYRDAQRSLVPATRPYNEDAHGNARVPLAKTTQSAISRGVGGGRMAHLMRWLAVVAMLAPGVALADATVTWPTKDEGGLTIPTRRTPVAGECNDNTLRKCWSAEIINSMAGNLVVDDDPQPGEVHRWTPCFRKGTGYVLAVCWNDCGQGLEARVPTNCMGPAQPVAPGVTWP